MRARISSSLGILLTLGAEPSPGKVMAKISHRVHEPAMKTGGLATARCWCWSGGRRIAEQPVCGAHRLRNKACVLA
jgi:hypothetical protein